MGYRYIHFRIKATGRAKRINSYLTSERKKGDDMNEIYVKKHEQESAKIRETEMEKDGMEKVGNPPLSRISNNTHTNWVS